MRDRYLFSGVIALLALALLVPICLSAQEDILLTRQAEAYFQAGDYRKAAELFQKLEGEKLPAWQNARVIYNIGTLDLEMGQWNEAFAEFSKLPFSPTSAPLLSRASKTNEAVGEYRQGTEILNSPKSNLDDYSKAIFLMRESLRDLQEADKADCSYALLLGKEHCAPPADLSELRTAAKKDLAVALRKYGEAKIAGSPVKEGVPFLLAGVKIALDHVDFLKSKKLNDKQQKSYRKLFERDIESWLSLWESQMDKMAELEEPYVQFVKGLDHLQKVELEEAQLAFLESQVSLTQWIHTLWGEDPFVEALQKLLISYRRTLEQSPVQVPTLYQLQTEQQLVYDLAETAKISLENFAMSNSFLKESIEFARRAKGPETLFFLQEAGQRLQRLLRQKIDKETTPEVILEEAINEQTHALGQMRLGKEIREKSKEVETLLKDAQEQTLTAAKSFISDVLAQEIADFPARCQCKPWNAVIPLYESGLDAAHDAEAAIGAHHAPRSVLGHQEKALKDWREALDKLRHPEEEKKPEAPPEQQQQPPPPEPQPASTEQVLEELQRMEQLDQRPQPAHVVPKEGTRPW